MVYSSIAELSIFDQYKNNNKIDMSSLIQELEHQNESKLNMSSCVNEFPSIRENELKINSNNDSLKKNEKDNKKKECNC